jgi:chromosome segregation ATPase
MKTFLVNLLIVLSLALCAFNAYQWYREARLRDTLRARSEALYQKEVEIQGLRQTLEAHTAEITRLERLRADMAEAMQSNQTLVVALQADVDRFRQDAALQAKKAEQIEEQYREAFEKANANLKAQNEIIQTQNEKLKQIAEDRNSLVGRFNKLAEDYKALGNDYSKVLGLYTNLVAQVQAANLNASR